MYPDPLLVGVGGAGPLVTPLHQNIALHAIGLLALGPACDWSVSIILSSDWSVLYLPPLHSSTSMTTHAMMAQHFILINEVTGWESELK